MVEISIEKEMCWHVTYVVEAPLACCAVSYLLHAAHGAAKDDDILGYLPLGHFIEIVETLLPLEALLTCHKRCTVAHDGNRHVVPLHFIKQIKRPLPLHRFFEAAHQ